jgi:hypothetical protein
MNVAVILTGHLRCWTTVFPNFKEVFIDRYHPDIFIHTWTDEGYWVPVEGLTGIHQHSPEIDVEAVRRAYKPVRIVVEKFDGFLPLFEERVKVFTNYYHRTKNIVSMFYKMQQGIQMVERHVAMTGKKYDLIIRVRPDMIIHQPLPDFDFNNFYTVWHRNHVGGGTGDQMQVGSLENVSNYVDLGINLEKVYVETGLLCPHVMSVHWIKKLNLPWQEIQIFKSLQHTPNGEYKAL